MKTILLLPLLVLAALPASAQYVTVGDPGNPNDQDYGPGAFGAVATTYAIGTYEVTLNQYATFLNAVAATDTFALYNTNMGSDLNSAGIARANSPGSYVYSVIGDGARPVTHVSGSGRQPWELLR
jgi:formylglycine-generating enzyme